jgi:hypothetical protein
MLDTIEGQGWLESIREPGKKWRVAYRFEITTETKIKSGVAGTEPVIRSSSLGTVHALDGNHIPQGEYRLDTDNGETLRLEYFDVWAIVPGA